jgi:phage-related protein
VFSAANTQGGGLLGVIESLTGQLSDFFKSAEGQDALTSFFGSLKSVADQVVPIVLALAEAFALHVAPIFATIAEEAGPTLRDLVERIGDAIGNIDAENLAEGFTDVLDAVLPLIDPLGKFIGWVSEIEGIVPAIVIALGAWAVAQWALNVAMWANPIGLIILAVIALIAIVWLIVANWDTITHVLATNWEWLKGKTEEVWGNIKEFFIGVWNAIKDFFVGVWTAIKDFFVGIWNAIVGFVENKVDQFMLTMGFLGSLPGKVAGWFQGVYDSAKNKLNSMIDWVKGVPDRVVGALGDLGSLLYNAGRDILQGLLDGIESMWNSVQNKLSDLTGMIPDWKGPEDTDKKLLTPAGKFIIGGLIEGIDSMIPQVQATLQGLTTDIGLNVDASAAPAAAAAPVINVAAPTGPDEYVVAVPIDLGEGITEVVEIKMRRRDADLKRRALAGTGRAR